MTQLQIGCAAFTVVAAAAVLCEALHKIHRRRERAVLTYLHTHPGSSAHEIGLGLQWGTRRRARTLYPVLDSLTAAGLITADWHDTPHPRTVYRRTEAGL